MPARSIKQQKFMGLALAYKRGDIPSSKVSKNVKQVADSMSEKELEKFAGTSHKGLPRKVKSTSEAAMVGPRWEYEDARGVKKKGTFVKSIERGGTDVTYVFKGDDGKEDLVSGAALKKAKRIYGEATMSDESRLLRLRERIEKTVRSILREGVDSDGEAENKEPLLTPEQKRLYVELIRKYNQYGESVYRQGKLRETYKNIKKIVEFASKNIVDESGDWFDGMTLSRHTKKMNESFKVFEKTVMEITKLQQRLEAVYEEIGETLGRYYEIDEGSSGEELTAPKKLKELDMGQYQAASERNRDAENPFGPVGMKTVTFKSGTPTKVIGQIITSKDGGRKTTFELPLDEKTYKSIVQKILNRFPHTGFGANVKGATTAYEEFKKMAIDKGIDVNE